MSADFSEGPFVRMAVPFYMIRIFLYSSNLYLETACLAMTLYIYCLLIFHRDQSYFTHIFRLTCISQFYKRKVFFFPLITWFLSCTAQGIIHYPQPQYQWRVVVMPQLEASFKFWGKSSLFLSALLLRSRHARRSPNSLETKANTYCKDTLYYLCNVMKCISFSSLL